MKIAFRRYLALLSGRQVFFLIFLSFLVSCQDSEKEHGSVDAEDTEEEVVLQYDIQGHRGARGVMPENSIEGFIYAVHEGVTTLELDVVITKDSQVVVSHEPWIADGICGSIGDTLLNMYKMKYAEVRRFDCGIHGNKRFAEQKKLNTYKPTLADAFQKVEEELYYKQLKPVKYNVEIKSTPEGDNIFHPVPAVFAQMVYNIIAAKGLKERVTIQSFDVRALQAMKEIDDNIPLVLLVSEEQDKGLEQNLQLLGFTPFAYSPEYTLVDSALVTQVHNKGMQLIPWTVNDSTEILNLLTLGTDGIITDLPAMGISVAKQYQKTKGK